MMKRFMLVLWGVAALSATGCGRRSKEITSLQRKEAASLASEAEFAVTLRDLPRAEILLTKVAALCPDTGEYWVGLGSLRMRLGDRDGAKSAYQSALRAYQDAAKGEKADGAQVLQQIHALALLGRVDEARKLLEKSEKKFPNDRLIRDFIQERQLDQMLADPTFKGMSL
jgi:tetratricopeptide (TPR) repeat protein